jgi:hypothetical protein
VISYRRRKTLKNVFKVGSLAIILASMAFSLVVWKAKPSLFNLSKAADRPAVCLAINSNGDSLTVSKPLETTIMGNPPAGYSITSFALIYYNLDNLYGPNNPKPIIFNGQQFVKTTCYRRDNNCTFTTTYSDLNRGDENWGGKKPIHIQVNGYFTLNDGRFSAADTRCVNTFSVTGSAAPTSTPIPTSTPKPPTSTPRPCTTCSGNGYSCKGKDAYRCVDRCLIYQGSCASFKTCSATLTSWTCNDNCPDNTYRCTTGIYEYLQKCINDQWTNQALCGTPGDECGCNVYPPSCYGACGD